ncbi:mercuric transport protein MerT [Bacillus pretiosus]|uniref:Mercuric transport protein MerT n=1 Tax=Bacillus pretiosus TaxID=2983392 RepID=A0ABT3EYT2_9BACI|nr:mercuric transport protein MerT [Bacillus pretiosus]MCW1241922.1 mercuric transport protein MerT [Bacillus pretiosus]
MKEKVSQLATIFSAFLMAACCLGPLILIPLGLTGFAGALAIYSIKYRLILIIVTFILLVYSFYLVYRRKDKKKGSMISLWFMTIVVFVMFLYILLAENYL